MSLRAVTFADLRTGVWGAAWSLHPDLPSLAVIGPERAVVAVDLRTGPAAGASQGFDSGPTATPASGSAPTTAPTEWTIVGEGLELLVVPQTAGIPDQLVTVRGRASEREFECAGARSERPDALEPGRFALARDVSAWFAPDEGFAMIALRPRKASGHGGEQTHATLFSRGETEPVAEPRLSTTYNDQQQPVRATLEMWFPDEEEPADDEQGRSVKYPRRAAGQAVGAGIAHTADGTGVRAQPFRWRAEGREGAGVYLLIIAR